MIFSIPIPIPTPSMVFSRVTCTASEAVSRDTISNYLLKKMSAPQPKEQKDGGGQHTLVAGGGANYGKHAMMPVLASDMYAEVNLPDLPEFNPEDIKIDATIVAIGKRRTGKTWVFRNIMYLMKEKINAGIVISQTDELNKFWRRYIPKKYIFKHYEPEILQAVFDRQKKMIDEELRKLEQEEGVTDVDERLKIAKERCAFFILLDDVISDQRLKYDPEMMELFVAGRHYALFILCTTQYAKAITPTIRGNTDYVFIMKTMQQRQREALKDDFGDFLTKDAFNQILDAYTEDNETLVVNTCPECFVDPMEMMSWWKAVDPGEFKMGSEDYWESSKHGDEQDVPQGESMMSGNDLMNMDMLMPGWAKAMMQG